MKILGTRDGFRARISLSSHYAIQLHKKIFAQKVILALQTYFNN